MRLNFNLFNPTVMALPLYNTYLIPKPSKKFATIASDERLDVVVDWLLTVMLNIVNISTKMT